MDPFKLFKDFNVKLDHTIFGENSKTYEIPFDKEFTFTIDLDPALIEKWVHPLGGTDPKDVGIDFPEINRFFFGQCGSTDSVHYDVISPFSAHTHSCPLDPLYNSICLWTKDYLRNRDGTISDALWHEYGHVITKLDVLLKHKYSANVVIGHSIRGVPEGYVTKDYWNEISHGSAWQQTMRDLGKPELAIKKTFVDFPS